MSLVTYRRRIERGDAVGASKAAPQTPLERALAELAEERAAHDLARVMLRERGEEVLALRDRIESVTSERDALKQLADSLEEQAAAPAPRHPRRPQG